SQVARKALTAVNAQERASTMPRLHRAKTVACGLVKWEKWAWVIVGHSVTRGWQDIGILLGVMGATQPPIPCPTEGCLVTSCMLSHRHFSKTYCRKAGGGQSSDHTLGARLSPISPIPHQARVMKEFLGA